MDKERIHDTVIILLSTAREQLDSTKYFLFSTTLEQYEVQLNLMSEMRAIWERDGMTVKKTYGHKQSDATHPLIQDYNKTVRSATSTANALLKIIDKAKLSDEQETGLKGLVDKMNQLNNG